MTLREAIDKADRFKPSQFSDEDKVEWLSNLDANIHNDILKSHEPVPEEDFPGYKMNDINNALLAPFPYDELYVAYLLMMIDLRNEDVARYNNSKAVFDAALTAYAKYVNKTQKPVFTTKFRIW